MSMTLIPPYTGVSNLAFVHCVTLRVNCGYARTAIWELTPKTATAINNTEKRESEFWDLYQQCPESGLTDFKNKNSGRSRFNWDCIALTDYFGKKWHPAESRIEYQETFSIKKWKALLPMQQKDHTYFNCKACHNEHSALQIKFAQGPYYIPQPLDTTNAKVEQVGEKEGTWKAFREVNDNFSQVFNKSFTTTLLDKKLELLQFWLKISPCHHTKHKLVIWKPSSDKKANNYPQITFAWIQQRDMG